MKKHLIKILLAGFSFTSIIFPQWSTDPNNNLIIGYGLDPKICSDSAGGCYITYDYENLSYPRKLALEKIDRYGYKPWGDKKQILGELPGQSEAEIIEDGLGGVIVSYEDREDDVSKWTAIIRLQKVDSSGNFLWGLTGEKITLEEVNQGLQQLVTDGEGGCVITWINTPFTYYVNRIGKDGNRMWGDSGVVLGTSAYDAHPRIIRAADGNYYVETGEYIYRIRQNGEIQLWDSTFEWGLPVATSDGGAIIHSSIWYQSYYNLLSQRKDSLGNNLWQEPYVEIADSLHINTFLNIKNINEYYYYNWTGKKNGTDLVSQFQALRLDGSKLFNLSLPISNYPIDALFGGFLPSDSGRTIMVWEDFRPNDGVFAQKIDTLGNRLWNNDDIRLYEGAYADLYTTTDGDGGAIGLGWHQFDFSIRIFKVSKNGIMGEVIIPVELISFTAKTNNNKVKLGWQTASEINNYGFEIERKAENNWEKIGFVPGYGTTTEIKSYSFIDENIFDGIYKYRLKQIDFDGTFKYSNELLINLSFEPKEYILFQNYPNPFNSSTIIKYEIPFDSKIRIELYNILGEKILTLYEGEKRKGKYQLSLSPEQLPSGVYFYSLETEISKLIRKLTILK